jgi:hypothetical protein
VPLDADSKRHFWRDVGLARQLSAQAVRRARMRFLLGALLIATVLVVYVYRRRLIGLDEPIRIATAIAILLSARPFRVGERVRLAGGNIGGQIEGVVSSLGLLYTVFASGEDSIMVPNNVVLNVAVIPSASRRASTCARACDRA